MKIRKPIQRLTIDDWLKIKTEYQLGAGIRALERKYNVSSSTIASRKTREKWTQNASKKLKVIQGDMIEFEQEFEQNQLGFARQELQSILELRKEVNGFIADAIKANRMNMKAALSEKDDFIRINMLAKIRANVVDIKEIVASPQLTIEDDDKHAVNEVVFRLE